MEVDDKITNRISEILEEIRNDSELISADFFKNNPEMSEDDVLSAVFKYYRQYEESHLQIIKDLGSDFILRLLGAYTSGVKSFDNKQDLEDYLNTKMDKIIQKEWELLPNQKAESEEFFDAFLKYGNNPDKLFPTEKGWR